MNSLTAESIKPYSPCDADPLLLAAREVDSLLADLRLVSAGQNFQVLSQGARLQGFLVERLLVALPEGDVVPETEFCSGLMIDYLRGSDIKSVEIRGSRLRLQESHSMSPSSRGEKLALCVFQEI